MQDFHRIRKLLLSFQKYRLYLSRLQKENELKATFGGAKHCDLSSRDSAGNVCLQNPITKNATTSQSSVLAEENFAVPGHKTPVHHDDPKMCEGNVVVNDPVKISYDHSFGPLNSNVKPEPKIQAQYSWSAVVQPPQFKKDQNLSFHSEPQFKKDQNPRFSSEHRLDPIPMSVHHIQVSSAETSHAPNVRTSNKESDKTAQPGPRKIKHIDKVTKVASTNALF